MKINNKLESAKRTLAEMLSTGSERFSTKTKKWIFVITGLICAILCITTMVLPFLNSKHRSLYVSASVPTVIQPQKQSTLLSVDEYRLLQGFIQTMDSLKRMDPETYQKAMTGREGMIDSILFLLRHSGDALITE